MTPATPKTSPKNTRPGIEPVLGRTVSRPGAMVFPDAPV